MKTKMNIKRKATIDDGCNPELVRGAEFDGYFGIPTIKKPEEIIIPDRIIPFSKLSKAKKFEDAIACYEMDKEFSDLLIHTDHYINDLKKHIFISPDCSLYRNALLELEFHYQKALSFNEKGLQAGGSAELSRLYSMLEGHPKSLANPHRKDRIRATIHEHKDQYIKTGNTGYSLKLMAA